MQVKDILKVKGNALFTVSPETPLSEAVITMSDHDIGSVVVLEQGRFAGMLTFREIINVLAKRQKEHRIGPTPPIASIKVGEAMQRQPFIAGPEMEVDDLRGHMLASHSRYVPVMQGGDLLGVISFHDVAKTVLEAHSFENKMLKAYIKDWPSAEGDGQGQS